MKKSKLAFLWFKAMSVGSMATSAGFYFWTDRWQPLVMSSALVALTNILGNLFSLDPVYDKEAR